jgi:ubiquitin carboxyl-terminal hydrolase 5/13
MTKLAIVADREEEKYEHLTVFKCWACDPVSGRELVDLDASVEANTLKGGIMTSMSSGRQSEVQAWEEEITPCEHTLMLEQLAIGPIAPAGISNLF